MLPLYLLSDLPPPRSQSKRTVYNDSVWLWGGGVLNCVVDHILQEFNTLFLIRFRTYIIATKRTSKVQGKYVHLSNLQYERAGGVTDLQ
jgi:hypothetical protein